MKEMFSAVSLVLYFLIGVISLAMAYKSLFSEKFLPFHEKASGKQWDELEGPLKLVITSLMRLGGLGFLSISILLIAGPIVNYFNPNIFYKFLIPGIALLYCTGLFLNNYILFKKTKARTPWKGSLYAAMAILAGMIISLFGDS